MTADDVVAAVLAAVQAHDGSPLDRASLIEGEPTIGVEDDAGELWFITVQPA